MSDIFLYLRECWKAFISTYLLTIKNYKLILNMKIMNPHTQERKENENPTNSYQRRKSGTKKFMPK